MTEKRMITERQYHILINLEKRDSPMSLRQMGQYINCSYKTVQNEVTSLNNTLPAGWVICSKKGIGISLIQPQNETVASTFSHDGNHLLFDLIDLLLTNETYSLEALCDKIHMSRNSIIKQLKTVEQFIEPFHLKLIRGPFHIVGNEGFKRLLLFEMHFSREGIFSHYTVQHAYKYLLPAKEMLEQQYQIRLTNYGFNSFCRCFHICKSRSEQGFIAEALPFPSTETLHSEPLFKSLEEFFCYLETLADVALSRQERIYLYIYLLLNEFELTIVDDKRRMMLLQQHHDLAEFTEFIHFLEEQLEVSITENEELLLHIFNLFEISKLRRSLPMADYLSGNSALLT